MTALIDLAIYGTPCGGTQFLSQALRAAGIDVGHEKLGPQGFVCGWAGFRLRKIDPDDALPLHSWRLLRDPRKTLETLPGYSHRTDTAGNEQAWMHSDVVVSALRWWVLLHERYRHLPSIRLASLDKDWPALVRPILGSVPPITSAEQNSKKRRWPLMTWEDLILLDPEYAPRARDIWNTDSTDASLHESSENRE